MDYTSLAKDGAILLAVVALLLKATPHVWREVVKWSDKALGRLTQFFDKLDAFLDTIKALHEQGQHDGRRHEDLSWRILETVEAIAERQGVSPTARPRRPRRPPQDPGGSATSPQAPATPPHS